MVEPDRTSNKDILVSTLKRTQIADKIKQLILTQKVKKGEQISERGLASDLGVARGTIRESLVKLADEGLIDSIPGIGAFVKDYSDSEIKDQIYIRSVLEGTAARFAAERINREQMRQDHPTFRPGDTIKVHIRIIEGNKERVQLFQGVVIKCKRGTMDASYTVRKISPGK